MSFSFSLFLPSGFSFPCRRSKGARVPETPCLFGNQTAVFLKCAEIDCALESAKKPRTAGLCGRAAGACDCGLLSCAFIERVNKGRKPPKRDRIGRKNTLEKAHFSEIGVVLKRYFHTSPTNAATLVSKGLGGCTHATPAPNRAHSGSHGETGAFRTGPLSLPSDCFTRCGNPAWPGGRTANFAAFGSWSEALLKNAESLRDSDALMRVAVPRRRGPAGLRDPVAVPLTALIGFTILLSRIVAHRKLSACSLVTAVHFLNRCLRRSMRETYPLGQRSGCRF